MANDSDSDPDVIPVGCSPFSSGGIRMDHWKADSSVHKCEHADCGKRFDLLVRRHHCRRYTIVTWTLLNLARCGGIFCSEHSKRTMSLTYDAKPTKEGGSLQRVCEACYSVGYYNNSPVSSVPYLYTLISLMSFTSPFQSSSPLTCFALLFFWGTISVNMAGFIGHFTIIQI